MTGGKAVFALDGAFPDGGDAVSGLKKLLRYFYITNDIIRELLIPETLIAFGLACEFAAMLMPEASVYENSNLVP